MQKREWKPNNRRIGVKDGEDYYKCVCVCHSLKGHSNVGFIPMLLTVIPSGGELHNSQGNCLFLTIFLKLVKASSEVVTDEEL